MTGWNKARSLCVSLHSTKHLKQKKNERPNLCIYFYNRGNVLGGAQPLMHDVYVRKCLSTCLRTCICVCICVF